jgi:hypothetical protein
MNNTEMTQKEIQDVKNRAIELFNLLQEPYHSPETIDELEDELDQLEEDYPELLIYSISMWG